MPPNLQEKKCLCNELSTLNLFISSTTTLFRELLTSPNSQANDIWGRGSCINICYSINEAEHIVDVQESNKNSLQKTDGANNGTL